MSSEKNASIASALKATCLKREGQQCRVYTVRVDMRSLKMDQQEALKMQFVEAKWISNEAIASEDLFKYTAGKTVTRRDKDGNTVETELRFLGSQAKQSVIEELRSNIKILSTLKKKGKKVGRIRFKKEVSAINLKQYGSTHRVIDKKHLAIQKVPGKIRVHGLDQILSNKGNIKFDIANAKLLNAPMGYFVAITCFEDKKERKHNGKEIGLDFGVSTHITTSEGKQYHSFIREGERLKKLQRKFARQQKGSKGKFKTLLLIKREYQKLTNQKNDLANKIVAELKQYEHIYMQDENLTGWKKLFGKQIHHSVMGRVKAKVRPIATHVLPRYVATTKTCVECGTVHKQMTLSDRRFICECGVDEDRDIHAATNMIALSKLALSKHK